MKTRKKIKNMAYASLCTAFLAVCALISIPSTVPFSMQTFGVYFVLLFLGGKWGSVSVLLYIALGVLGAPVFSGFNSGFGVLLGPSGGFIIGFLAICATYRICESLFPEKMVLSIIFMVLGTIICYIIGVAFYMFWCAEKGNDVGVSGAVTVCVLPYILPDFIKLVLAYALAPKLKRYVRT